MLWFECCDPYPNVINSVSHSNIQSQVASSQSNAVQCIINLYKPVISPLYFIGRSHSLAPLDLPIVLAGCL